MEPEQLRAGWAGRTLRGKVIRREGSGRAQGGLGKDSECSFYSLWASGQHTHALVLLIWDFDYILSVQRAGT